MVSFLCHYDDYPDGLEVWEAAIILHVAQDTVRRFIRAKQLSAYRFGRGYIIPKSEVRAFIIAHASKRKGETNENP